MDPSRRQFRLFVGTEGFVPSLRLIRHRGSSKSSLVPESLRAWLGKQRSQPLGCPGSVPCAKTLLDSGTYDPVVRRWHRCSRTSSCFNSRESALLDLPGLAPPHGEKVLPLFECLSSRLDRVHPQQRAALPQYFRIWSLRCGHIYDPWLHSCRSTHP